MPERQQLTEARATLLAEATGTAGRYRVQLIDAGWGSSGYYAPAVLAEAASNRVFAAGLHMYADHPRDDGSGVDQHGNRSVRDLWAVLESDATLSESGALVADVRVFGPYRPLVEDMRADIGLSIRALGQFDLGEAEGRRGRIITSIDEARSVDFVSSAGRGGRILEVIESARGEALTESTARAQLQEARNVGQWIESRLHLSLTQIADEMFGDGRLTREERIALSGAVGDGLQAFTASLEQSAPQLYTRDLWEDPAAGLAESTANDIRDALSTAVSDTYRVAEQTWACVLDYVPDVAIVYFDISGDETGTFQQSYVLADDGSASLTGERTEVTVRTSYVPVGAAINATEAREWALEMQLEDLQEFAADCRRLHRNVPVGTPAGQSITTESQGGTMPEIEEARLRQLEADAGRVQTLESERDTAQAERDAARRALAEADARTAARPVVLEVFTGHELPAAVHTRVVEAVVAATPLTDAGELDEAALRTAATAARTAAETEVAAIAESLGAGTVRGFGGGGTTAGLTESGYSDRSGRVFGRQTVKGA